MLKKSSLVFCLLSCTLASFATNVSGEFFLDSLHQTLQKDQNDVKLDKNYYDPSRLGLSKGQINFNYSITPSWAGEIAVSLSPDNLNVMTKWPVFFSKSYCSYKASESFIASLGLNQAPDITVNNNSDYTAGIDNTAGRVIQPSKNYLSLRFDGVYAPFSYNIAVWEQTRYARIKQFLSQDISNLLNADQTLLENINPTVVDQLLSSETSFTSHLPEMAFGWRLGFTPVTGRYSGYCAGGGFISQPLEKPLIVGTIAGDGLASFTAFNCINSLAADFSWVAGGMQLSGGGNYQRMSPRPHYYSTPSGGTISELSQRPASVFDIEGVAHSWWLQTAYLFGTGHYAIDPHVAMISSAGQGLEFALTYGQSVKKNIMALIDYTGSNDFINSNYLAAPAQAPISGEGRLILGQEGPATVGIDHYHDLQGYDLVAVNNIPVEETSEYYVYYGSLNYYADASKNYYPVTTDINYYATYQIKTISTVLNINYRFDDNLMFKFELQQDKHYKVLFNYDCKIYNAGAAGSVESTVPTYVPSIYKATAVYARLRAQYKF